MARIWNSCSLLLFSILGEYGIKKDDVSFLSSETQRLRIRHQRIQIKTPLLDQIRYPMQLRKYYYTDRRENLLTVKQSPVFFNAKNVLKFTPLKTP